MTRRTRGAVALFGAALLAGAGCGGAERPDDPTASTGPTPRTATGPAPPGAVTFAGWHWSVKTSPTAVGPGPNRFGDVAGGNVLVDAEGRLHLRITRRQEGWYSAEVAATESMGYGTYTWVLEPPATPDEPNAVLGLFTWSDEPAQNHREIDIELSQFRRADGDVAGQYVVQPHERSDNLVQFARPIADAATVRVTWRPGEIAFAVLGAVPESWSYTGPDIPRPGGEVHPRMNLWLLAGSDPANDLETEAVIRTFTFAPDGA
jgi:hypothetical protein